MDLSVYLSLIIIMLTRLVRSQTTVKYSNTVQGGACEAQYSEILHSVSKMSEDIEEIKKTLSNDATKKMSQYQIFFSEKKWIDADLSCFVLGGHLVSFEDLAELIAVSNMITQPWSDKVGFWTAGRDIGNNNWIWRNRGDPIKAGCGITHNPIISLAVYNSGKMFLQFDLLTILVSCECATFVR